MPKKTVVRISIVRLNINDQQYTARVNARSQAKMGDKIEVAFDTNRIHVFDKETEKTIIN